MKTQLDMRRPVDSDRRRRLVLEAAVEYYFDVGLQNGTINGFASSVGLAKPVLYRVFPSKQALETAIFEPIIDLVHKNRHRPFTGAGSHVFPLLDLMRTKRKAALLTLRDCRTSVEHQHWFKAVHSAFAEALLIVFEPAPDAAPGGEDRARRASETMANFYVETLAGWLENRDGLNDEQRRIWFTQVVTVWREAARTAYGLGELEFSYKPPLGV